MPGMSVEQGSAKPVPTGPSPAGNTRRFRRGGSWTLQLHPFPADKHKCAVVKVIDPRGNEVMKVHRR
jgi:hypothetical protein